MCCCGNEHDADPPYKTSRSAACCTLTIEIILMVVNVILWIAVAVAGILVCAIAAATEPEGKTTTYVPKFSTFNSANNCDSSANSPATQVILSKENCELAARTLTNACDDKTAVAVTSNAPSTMPYGCTCDKSSNTHVLTYNTDISVYTRNANTNNWLICRQTGTRRLGEISANRPAAADLTSTTTTHLINSYAPYLVPGFDSKFTNGDFITNTLTKGHHSAGRRLDACDDDEDCSKLKKAGQTGCNAASTILSMFWINNLFALLGVIFYAMVACNCCKGCCGGYQDKNKMVMIYSVIAAIWGLVQTILHASLNAALNAVKEVCVSQKLHPNVVTFIEGMATTILICTLFHALCMILRLVSAYFMFKAQKVPHNGDAGANGGVPAAVVPAQQVIVVQEAK